MAARAFFSVLIVLLLYRYRKYASTNYFLDLVYLSFLLQCHSRLHVVTGLARSDFVPPHSHVHLQNGRQQDGQCGLFAAVGNRRCEWHRSYEAPAAQAATRQAQGTSNASRNCSRRNVAPLAGCPLFRVFCQWFRNAPAHVRYVSITTSWPDVLPSACRVATCTSRETPPPALRFRDALI